MIVIMEQQDGFEPHLVSPASYGTRDEAAARAIKIAESNQSGARYFTAAVVDVEPVEIPAREIGADGWNEPAT